MNVPENVNKPVIAASVMIQTAPSVNITEVLLGCKFIYQQLGLPKRHKNMITSHFKQTSTEICSIKFNILREIHTSSIFDWGINIKAFAKYPFSTSRRNQLVSSVRNFVKTLEQLFSKFSSKIQKTGNKQFMLV